ncbi:MAG: hypothetical protein JXB88_18280 [Spirochaetales bacterium]|nr:hypothetical protein [Spirochaetales bacterium]
MMFIFFFPGCSSPSGGGGGSDPTPVPSTEPSPPPSVLEAPEVIGPEITKNQQPVWTWNEVPGAINYRYSFTEGSGWVETTDTFYTPGTPLENGSYTLYVQAGDGNDWSGSGSWTIEVDTTLADPPEIAGITAGAYNTTQSFTLTLDPGATAAYYSLNNGTDWLEYAGEVFIADEGEYRLIAKQVVDGKTSESTYPSLDFSIDKTAPDPPTDLDLAADDDKGTSNTDNITNQASELTISGDAEAYAEIELFSNVDDSLGTTFADENGDWSKDVSLSEDTHSITATAADAATNVSGESTALVIEIDTSAPASPSTPDLAPEDDSGSSDSDNITKTTTGLTFTGTADADISMKLVSSLDGELASTTATGAGNYTFDSVAITVSVNHTHTITAQATDTAGNTGTSAGLTLVIDTTAPAVYSKFSDADRIIAIDTSVSTNFTGESDISSSWNSTSKELTLKDPAWNSTVMSQAVYEGAETDGLRTAVETDAVDGEIIYLCAGTYSLLDIPGGAGRELQIGSSLTLRGDGSATTMITQTIVDKKRIIQITGNNKTVAIEYLGLDAIDRECIFGASGIAVNLYVRDLYRGTTLTGSRNLIVVAETGSTVYYWNGSDYSTAVNGVDDWVVVTDGNISFMGVADTTYWD